MRIKLTWALILAVMFVCVATGCHTAERWSQCAVAAAVPEGAQS